jgi:hypothetical protein
MTSIGSDLVLGVPTLSCARTAPVDLLGAEAIRLALLVASLADRFDVDEILTGVSEMASRRCTKRS